MRVALFSDENTVTPTVTFEIMKGGNIMKMNKLAPWNWFKNEEEQQGTMMPVRRDESRKYVSHPLLQIHDEIDRMFNDFFKGFGFPEKSFWSDLPATQTGWLKPTCDIAANDKEYTITAELPGVDEKNIELELVNDTLKIKGEKKQETEEKEKNYYRVERSYGSFQRTLTLPEDSDRDKINATFKNGIMTITIPRKTTGKPPAKKIDINAQ